MTESADLLMEFALSLLVPFLTTGSLTDPALARRAAAETIAAYKAAGQDQFVTIAQLVAFALASLDNLRLSMPQDLSLSMKLKLRGNANALNRSSQRATATLDRQRRDITPPERDETEILAALEAAKTVVQQALAAHPPEPTATPAPPPATPALANPIRLPDAAETPRKNIHAPATYRQTTYRQTTDRQATDRHIDFAWASAMTDVAAEYTAELPHLTPAQRQTHLARIGALSQISTMLGQGEAPPLKSRLLASTTLRG